jgi:hypothetical protein
MSSEGVHVMMKKPSLVAILASTLLCFASAALGGTTTYRTKGYSIVLVHPLKAGNVQLKAGEYNMKVNGDNAVFAAVGTSNTVSVPVKIETTDKKMGFGLLANRVDHSWWKRTAG